MSQVSGKLKETFGGWPSLALLAGLAAAGLVGCSWSNLPPKRVRPVVVISDSTTLEKEDKSNHNIDNRHQQEQDEQPITVCIVTSFDVQDH